MATVDRGGGGALLEALACVLAHCLEHHETVAAAHEQALHHQRIERVKRRFGHILARPHGATASEHGTRGEGIALGISEQIEAPVDRGPQGALAGGRVARPAAECGERRV
jgi:hypothetical protein